MILQALHSYYGRASQIDGAEIAPPGWIRKPIDYIVVLNQQGEPVRLDSRFEIVNGKRRAARAELLPNIGKQAQKHTNSGKDANLLWDNSAFALGCGGDGAKKLSSFRATLSSWFPNRIAAIESLQQFLQRMEEGSLSLAALTSNESEYEMLITGAPTITFSLVGELELICHHPTVRAAYELRRAGSSSGVRGICLVTGAPNSVIELNETVIKRVFGGQTSGTNVVSFNERAFESYGKTKRAGENAPISKAASFAYSTALNFLLREGSRNRIQVGDASTVFWAEEPSELETAIPDLFGEVPKDDPDRSSEAVKALYKAIDTGRLAGPEGEGQFYVLGLAPNAARISVRFWMVAPLREIAIRIRSWFDDLAIVRGRYDGEYPSLKRLLSSTCLATKDRPHGDIDRLPPTIAGDVIRAILTGSELPAAVLSGALQRCRAEQAKKDEKTGKPVRNVSHLRASLIRAHLNRSATRSPQHKEISVALDKTNIDKPYLLGRLFATFERMQEVAAERDLNRTVRDAYFGAAMATPRSVFPRLIRLNQQHFRDMKRSRPKSAFYFDRLLREINDQLDPAAPFPPVCNLHEQGVFAIGYYHQRHDFYPTSEATSGSANADTSPTNE